MTLILESNGLSCVGMAIFPLLQVKERKQPFGEEREAARQQMNLLALKWCSECGAGSALKMS